MFRYHGCFQSACTARTSVSVSIFRQRCVRARIAARRWQSGIRSVLCLTCCRRFNSIHNILYTFDSNQKVHAVKSKALAHCLIFVIRFRRSYCRLDARTCQHSIFDAPTGIRRVRTMHSARESHAHGISLILLSLFPAACTKFFDRIIRFLYIRGFIPAHSISPTSGAARRGLSGCVNCELHPALHTNYKISV